LKLTVRGQVVPTLPVHSGNPSYGPGNDTRLEGIIGQAMRGNARFVIHF
jgi:hypothetical protein